MSTSPILERIAASQSYEALPEIWRIPGVAEFSEGKRLYDYQQEALKKAVRALWLYYGGAPGAAAWRASEAAAANLGRKRALAGLYQAHGEHPDAEFSIPQFASNADRNRGKLNPVFRILSEFLPPQGERIPYHQIINRMCFWMATGSGKTLVMVKLIEILWRLMRHGEIPGHRILLLAPSDYLLDQIRRTVEEFNASGGLQIALLPLRGGEHLRQGVLGDALPVYFHRSDNISDVQKEALTDYRQYEDGGRWFVLLDEAHKGGKEDSKRQAYYALMAREGFLFNFSATFADSEDIQTTVNKYNLEDFISGGRGKNIYLNQSEYRAFASRQKDTSVREKQRIVLQSLITLTFVSSCRQKLLEQTGRTDLYHRPLMLTLVHSVETVQNDLLQFFQILRKLAANDMDEALFKEAKAALKREWSSAQMLLGDDGGAISRASAQMLAKMRITDLREAVFLSRRRSALEYIRSQDNRELAFKMKNCDAPFALIRIGNTATATWRNKFLRGFEEATRLDSRSFFSTLDENLITILMGSRSFFESWDSNRPNVINFINIGASEARKFVLQSIGRGVRDEPLPGQRLRQSRLPAAMQGVIGSADLAAPLETLFLFATNRSAISSVLNSLAAKKTGSYEKVEGFIQSKRPQLGNAKMPLLVPRYREEALGKEVSSAPRAAFAMSEETRERFQGWLDGASDSLLAVREGLTPSQTHRLHEMIGEKRGLRIAEDKSFEILSFLMERLKAHMGRTEPVADGVQELNEKEDIVHFRNIRAKLESYEIEELSDKVREVARGGISEDEERTLAGRYAAKEISKADFNQKMAGRWENSYKDLDIKHIASHYYVPVITAPEEKADFIQHIIKVPSEVAFLKDLESALGEAGDWDAWMFSKIDESLDQIHIPYYDNEDQRFYPDFIFWMCRGNEYRIVFADPKGMEHTKALRKIDGYTRLFEHSGKPRGFSHASRWKVSVHLLLFNSQGTPPEAYERFWTDDPAAIFRA